MARKQRIKSETGIYHIILRGINKQIIFEEEEDYIKFIETLRDYQEECSYKIYAYCLMGNHIHLLIQEVEVEIANVMRKWGASFVKWYNWKYDRIGHLFQDRYKSEPVKDEKYLLMVMRYIHNNPIKAGIAKDFKRYKWSSYSSYFNVENIGIVDIKFVLDILGSGREKALEKFELFHNEENSDKCLEMQYKVRITDSVGVDIIRKVCDIKSCKDIQQMNAAVRNEKLKVLKSAGLSTRQLERLTGISRHLILNT